MAHDVGAMQAGANSAQQQQQHKKVISSSQKPSRASAKLQENNCMSIGTITLSQDEQAFATCETKNTSLKNHYDSAKN